MDEFATEVPSRSTGLVRVYFVDVHAAARAAASLVTVRDRRSV